MLVLQTVSQTTKCQMLLGKAVYQQLFQIAQPVVNTVKVQYRYLRGQVIGKALPRGTGQVDLKNATMDPAMCQHPADKMVPRGNKTDKWWLCKACVSRWERLETIPTLSSQSITVDPSQEILPFGRYMGRTYAQIFEDDPMYCAMICMRTDQENPEQELAPSPDMMRFSSWLNTQPVRERCAQLLQIQEQMRREIVETYEADDWSMESSA